MTPIPRPNIRMDASPSTSQAGTPVILSLGSNLGDRAAILGQAVREIAGIDGFDLTGSAPLYTSAALTLHGVDHSAPSYLNSAVSGRYAKDPHELLVAINAIENGNGRVRAERWGNRTLDIDIIVFGDLRVDDDTLTLPHPRASERDFVLVPWLDLDPDAHLPGRGRVADLLTQLDITIAPYEGAGT